MLHYFIHSHLLPDYKKKFKTKVMRDTTNPVWNERFVFEKVKLEDLRSNRVLELTVWDLLKNTKHYDFIGGLRIGPRPHHDKQLPYMDSYDAELSHWMSVVDTPGNSVELLHTLRHNMDPRSVTLATSEPFKEETNQSEYLPGHESPDHHTVPQYESTPLRQPDITITTEDTSSEVRSGYHSGSEHSQLKRQKMKFDDADTSELSESTSPSHQVITLTHPPHHMTNVRL